MPVPAGMMLGIGMRFQRRCPEVASCTVPVCTKLNLWSFTVQSAGGNSSHPHICPSPTWLRPGLPRHDVWRGFWGLAYLGQRQPLVLTQWKELGPFPPGATPSHGKRLVRVLGTRNRPGKQAPAGAPREKQVGEPRTTPANARPRDLFPLPQHPHRRRTGQRRTGRDPLSAAPPRSPWTRRWWPSSSGSCFAIGHATRSATSWH